MLIRTGVCVCVCVCVCACVCVCLCVFVTYENTHLYNDVGVTGITRRRCLKRTFPHDPIFQKGL